MAAFARARPVAVILDWTLPDEPGIEVCRHVRAQDRLIPIIFTSGRDDETTSARGLDAGADDYVAKPVKGGELIARLEAHLRRAMAIADVPAPTDTAKGSGSTHHFGDVEVDIGAHELRVRGTAVPLGPMEFKLLDYLVRNAGVAVSREQILSEVYGYDADIETDRVDLLVRRLRAKLRDTPKGGGSFIVAVAGYAYRLDRPGESYIQLALAP